MIIALEEGKSSNIPTQGINLPHFLIIDDLGLMTLDSTKCMRLFTILDARERRKATLVISQIPAKDWYETFSDMTYADACLDRLAKGSFRIVLEGPRLRPE